MFAVNSTDPNKQLLNANLYLNLLAIDLICQKYIYIYIFLTFLGIEILLFIKHDLVIFSIFSFDIPLIFHNLIQVVPLEYLMYFFASISIK